MIDKTVVKQLEVEKYLGTWYEIARYDNRFERGLVGVTVIYSMRNDAKLRWKTVGTRVVWMVSFQKR